MVDALIGHTPVVKLKSLAEPGSSDVFVKLEGQNPGGSIKDRTALGLIEDAEARGWLRPGGLIVEPTSGNTGIGLAQVAAARGYRLVLCMPASMSEERKRTLAAYGAELVLTDPSRRMLAAIEEAEKIAAERGGWMPNQFENPANPAAHEATTGPELWQQMEGRIDAFVYGSGTGGTITGVGRYLRKMNPAVKIYAVEPARSNVLSGGERGDHGFQGMGPGFIPGNLDRSLIDEVIQVWEEDAYPLARRLAREEGAVRGHVQRRHHLGCPGTRPPPGAGETDRHDCLRLRRALPDHPFVRRQPRYAGSLPAVLARKNRAACLSR